jgi:hypothetical protein
VLIAIIGRLNRGAVGFEDVIEQAEELLDCEELHTREWAAEDEVSIDHHRRGRSTAISQRCSHQESTPYSRSSRAAS